MRVYTLANLKVLGSSSSTIRKLMVLIMLKFVFIIKTKEFTSIRYITFTQKKLTSIFTIKAPVISRLVNQSLEDYRETISHIGNKLEFINARELRDYL
jgi:hypothetical protein